MTTSITHTNDIDMVLDESDTSFGLDLPSPLDVVPEPTLSQEGNTNPPTFVQVPEAIISNGQEQVPAPERTLSYGQELVHAPEPTLSHEHNPNPVNLAQEKTGTSVPLDDIERLICHENFPALLAMATKVKEIRHAMDADYVPASMSPSSLDPNHVIAAVARIKQAFVSKASDVPIVQKGTYPLTDSMIDESFEILQKEAERCEEWYKQREVGKLGKRIANKYAKWQTDLLMGWMIEHKHYPFPTSEEVKELAEQTGLTQTQIVNWTTNVRKRNLKATVEGGKKPHHFLDFCFLAQDRDVRLAKGLPEKRVPQILQSKRARKNKKYQIPPPPVVQLDLTKPPPTYQPFASPTNGGRLQQHTHQPFPAYHHAPSVPAYQAPAVPPPADVPLPPIEWDLSHDDDDHVPTLPPQEPTTVNQDPLSAFADYWTEQTKNNPVPTLTTSEQAFEAFQAETNGGLSQPMDILAAASLMQAPPTRSPFEMAAPDNVTSI